MDSVICRCEEITEAEILEAIHEGARTLADVKRRTRVGMGTCQGKTCQRIVAAILARELGCSIGEITPFHSRPPTRPMPISAFLSDGSQFDSEDPVERLGVDAL